MKEIKRTPNPLSENDPSPSQPSYYVIRVKGHLDPGREWLEGLTVTHTEPGATVLSGPMADQAALHGLLARIRDLNLELLSVNQVGLDERRKEGSDG